MSELPPPKSDEELRSVAWQAAHLALCNCDFQGKKWEIYPVPARLDPDLIPVHLNGEHHYFSIGVPQPGILAILVIGAIRVHAWTGHSEVKLSLGFRLDQWWLGLLRLIRWR
jgi:hypothetical protein